MIAVACFLPGRAKDLSATPRMCFVRISEKTAIISLCSINWLVLIRQIQIQIQMAVLSNTNCVCILLM